WESLADLRPQERVTAMARCQGRRFRQAPRGWSLCGAALLAITLVPLVSRPGRAGEPVALEGHKDLVRYLAFSPDGKLLASRSNGVLKLWDVASAKEVRSLPCWSSVPVSFSPDGKTLAC